MQMQMLSGHVSVSSRGLEFTSLMLQFCLSGFISIAFPAVVQAAMDLDSMLFSIRTRKVGIPKKKGQKRIMR